MLGETVDDIKGAKCELRFRWTLNRLGLDSNFAANKERTHGRHKLVGDMIVRIFWNGKMSYSRHHEVKGI